MFDGEILYATAEESRQFGGIAEISIGQFSSTAELSAYSDTTAKLSDGYFGNSAKVS